MCMKPNWDTNSGRVRSSGSNKSPTMAFKTIGACRIRHASASGVRMRLVMD
jgi:hypothetical protein